MNEGAQHVASRLMRKSLVDKKVIAGTKLAVRAILPTLNVIQIGGLSIMDRGHTRRCSRCSTRSSPIRNSTSR